MRELVCLKILGANLEDGAVAGADRAPRGSVPLRLSMSPEPQLIAEKVGSLAEMQSVLNHKIGVFATLRVTINPQFYDLMRCSSRKDTGPGGQVCRFISRPHGDLSG